MSSKLEFITFPPVINADEDGLLAMGGDLNLNTLVSAYSQGVFPWYNDDQPILWWSPDPRTVLFPNDIKVSRSLAKNIKNAGFIVTCNKDFDAVISACALRGQQDSQAPIEETWIGDDMRVAYSALHKQHYAHSIEVWQNNELVGGLYGLAIGNTFFGESMFSRASNASKVALVTLCKALSAAGFNMIDCQVASDHLFSLGAVEISRERFLGLIEGAQINEPIVSFSDWFEQASDDDGITTL
jgi:leucyl/phenylalanyl-tRNA--protein transferase